MGKKRIIIGICISLLIVLLLLVLIWSLNENYKRIAGIRVVERHLFENQRFLTADIVYYTLYGQYLNVNIVAPSLRNSNSLQSATLLLLSEQGTIEYPLAFKESPLGTLFYISGQINQGIFLDDLNEGRYEMVLKVEESAPENKIEEYYFVLSNQTEYPSLEYYTVTDLEGKNRKIEIGVQKLLNPMNETMVLEVEQAKLPEDVYDIVIDPGHGGADVGASGYGYNEADLTLQISLLLRDQLEEKGFKVKLTREEDIRLDTYGENGRYVMANELNAKFQLSIHLNSSSSSLVEGVEIYSPPNASLTFSENLVATLQELTDATTSPNRTGMVLPGVYVRNFTLQDIIDSNEMAQESGYLPYDINTSTAYYGIIREAGGICTGAYVDGRNKDYGANAYWDQNKGVETYLLELGYITSSSEIRQIRIQMQSYIEAIATSTAEYLR